MTHTVDLYWSFRSPYSYLVVPRLQELEREWLQTPDIVLASDAHGVVFLASQDAWRYRLLEPLDDEERRELNATRQYSDQPLRPLAYRVDSRLDNGGRLVRVQSADLPALPGRDAADALGLAISHAHAGASFAALAQAAHETGWGRRQIVGQGNVM